MMIEEAQLEVSKEILRVLRELLNKTTDKSNTHETFTFSTAGSASFHKDVHELLALPRGYFANNMTVLDVGGGFSYKINGENEAITAANNQKLTDEEIYKIELIPATSAGTAKVRFGAHIYNER